MVTGKLRRGADDSFKEFHHEKQKGMKWELEGE